MKCQNCPSKKKVRQVIFEYHKLQLCHLCTLAAMKLKKKWLEEEATKNAKFKLEKKMTHEEISNTEK